MHDDEFSGLDLVAVTGMAGRFPGADDVAALWELLRSGNSGITHFDEDALRASGVDPEISSRPEYVAAKGVVSQADYFDAEFFGLSPREAEIMDPQIRLFLECAWHACEDAGIDPQNFDGRIGLFAGANQSTYLLANLIHRPDLVSQVGELAVKLGNDKDALATWTAYKLDLRGPVVAVQTACSTSLTAVHLACQALLDRDCDLALAGGVGVGFPLPEGYLYQEGGILSPDGHCRPFDARARGTVPGTGAGLVVLRRLEEAQEGGDTIRAVLLGTAISNDGALKAGYTAPGVEGQMRAVAEAQAVAEVEPRSIGYVETHGSGTSVGDPIEIEALTRAFLRGSKGQDGRSFCALGSAKANLGHLDSAAGIVGLIKTVCALEQQTLPPMRGFETPNPEIDFENSPFFVPTEARPWDSSSDFPRRAGVSSFGIGGTNVHAVLEEAPASPAPAEARSWQPLLLSARSREAVAAAGTRLADHLEARPGLPLADVAWTLAKGRRAFRHRGLVLAQELDEAVQLLRVPLAGRAFEADSGGEGESCPGVVFVFPGLGDQHPGMGRELYREEDVFRREVDRCAELLRPRLGLDLRDLLYAEEEASTEATETDLRQLLGRAEEPESEASRRLWETRWAHPAVFVVEYALARLLMSWGLEPKAMIGYSLGEYVAATLAGVFDLEDALALVADRARMVDDLPPGKLLAVPLPEEEVRPKIEGRSGISLAAVNGDGLTVVGGEREAVDRLVEEWRGAGVECRPLRTSHAFHTTLLEPLRQPFARRLGEVRLREPRIPFLSNLTGTWIRPQEAVDPLHWANHLVETVRFGGGLDTLFEDERFRDMALLEVGPGQSLTTLARQQDRSGRPLLSTLPDRRRGQSESCHLLAAVGQLWLEGLEVPWDRILGSGHRKVSLPGYPFERKRFWVEPGEASWLSKPSASVAKSDLRDWFYLPSWRRAGPVRQSTEAGEEPENWLLLTDESAVGHGLAAQAKPQGVVVTAVEAGEGLDLRDGDRHTINPREREHFSALMTHLQALERWPAKIVHFWAGEGSGDLGTDLDRGFHSLLFLAQAVAEREFEGVVEIVLVTRSHFDVLGTESKRPELATLLGPFLVLPQEMPGLHCRWLDLDAEDVDSLYTELRHSREERVALRGPHRWVPGLLPWSLGSPANLEEVTGWRRGGVYVLTGGAGATQRHLAERLVRELQAQVVVLCEPGQASGSSQFVEIEVDATDPTSLQRVFSEVVERFGQVSGVFHTDVGEVAGLAQLESPDSAAQALRPKAWGTLALAQALEGVEPEFLVLFGGTSGLLGGVGQGAQSAANAFLGAFAKSRSSQGGPRVLALDWDTFRWQDHDPSGLPEAMARQLDENLERYGIEADEMWQALWRALDLGSPHLVISGRDLAKVVEEHRTMKGQDLLTEWTRTTAVHQRPELETPYRVPSTESERALARLWQEAFGLEKVGVDDDFFALDGNSLLAIQIATRLRGVVGVDVPVGALFEAPTVALLAAKVDELSAASDEDLDESEIDALLAEVEDLSDEQAAALLADAAG